MQITIELPEDRLEQLLATVFAINGSIVQEAETEWVLAELDKRLADTDTQKDMPLTEFMARYRERGI